MEFKKLYEKQQVKQFKSGECFIFSKSKYEDFNKNTCLNIIDNKKNVPDILASKSIIEMTKVNPDGLDPLGWRSTNENGEWWRTGTLNGTSALIKRQPDGFSWVILSNTSNYKGPRLAIEMDRVMTTVLHKVKEWPDLDLFAYYNN